MACPIPLTLLLVVSDGVIIHALCAKVRRLSSSILLEELSRIFVLAICGWFHRDQLHLLESRFFQHAEQLGRLILGLFLLLLLSALVKDFDEALVLLHKVL